MAKAVLFDLDGTLLNTLYDLADSGNHVLSLNGWPTHEAEAYKYFVGDGVTMLVRRILPEAHRTPDEIERVKKVFVEHYQAHAIDKTGPYDGVEKMLDSVKKSGLKMAVISNKPDAQTQYIVSKFFGDGFFDYVIGNRQDLPLKPDPAIVRLALESLGVSTGDAQYVGDTGTDMKTAKNAACFAVGVTWGFRPKEELLENGADIIINTPDEIVGLL
jgi:phosphoglycolate phosphatase